MEKYFQNLRYAPDRTKIPNISFSYELSEIDNENDYKIGTDVRFGYETAKIEKGKVKGALIKLNDIVFSEKDVYYDEIGKYLADNSLYYMDSVVTPIFDNIFKYGEGIIGTNNDSERAFFKSPTEFLGTNIKYTEEQLKDLGPKNNWTTSVKIPWRCYSPVNLCETIYDYDFHEFQYSKIFETENNMDVYFENIGYTKDMLLTSSKDAQGKYESISKTLFNLDNQMKIIREVIQNNNIETENFSKIFRYILTETSENQETITTNKTKILDIFIQDGLASSMEMFGETIQDGHVSVPILLFDSVDEADNYYKNNKVVTFFDPMSADTWGKKYDYKEVVSVFKSREESGPLIKNPATGLSLNIIVIGLVVVISILTILLSLKKYKMK